MTQTPITLYVDGASRGNPGKGGLGVFAFQGSPSSTILSEGVFFGKITNNVAEYAALAYALHLLKEQQTTAPIHVHADSLLLIKQVTGEYRVRNANLMRWHSLIMLLKHSLSCTFTHVRREKNKQADALANQGVDLKTLPQTSFIELLKRHQLVPDHLLS